MRAFYNEFRKLNIDRSLILLESCEQITPYFCYPTNAEPIGFEGCIMYCFLPEYGGMVFAANPESCADQYVYPLADNFQDFLSLILSCGTVNPIEQIIWMDEATFDNHLRTEKSQQTDQQKNLLSRLAQELHIAPMDEPYQYVKQLQREFDDSRIMFSDEYYDVLGIDR